MFSIPVNRSQYGYQLRNNSLNNSTPTSNTTNMNTQPGVIPSTSGTTPSTAAMNSNPFFMDAINALRLQRHTGPGGSLSNNYFDSSGNSFDTNQILTNYFNLGGK